MIGARVSAPDETTKRRARARLTKLTNGARVLSACGCRRRRLRDESTRLEEPRHDHLSGVPRRRSLARTRDARRRCRLAYRAVHWHIFHVGVQRTNGRIQYLTDCTHAMAQWGEDRKRFVCHSFVTILQLKRRMEGRTLEVSGQTVDLPDIMEGPDAPVSRVGSRP